MVSIGRNGGMEMLGGRSFVEQGRAVQRSHSGRKH